MARRQVPPPAPGDPLSEALAYDAEVTVYEAPPPGPPVDPPTRERQFLETVSYDDGPTRAPIVPPSMRPGALPATAVAAVKRGSYVAAFHALRSPRYLIKTLLWSPVGVVRGVWLLIYWARDLEGHTIRQHTATRNQVKEYLDLSKQRDRRVGPRMRILFAGLAAAAVLVWLLLAVAPHWLRWPVLALALIASAIRGRPVDKPITDRVTVGERFIKLTAVMCRTALMATLPEKIKEPGAVTFPRDIYRDKTGWTAIVQLPLGTVVADVLDRRDRLASGFRLPMSQVWPRAVDGHPEDPDRHRANPGLLRIWVADVPVTMMRQPPWPLLRGGKADYFRALPAGFDEQLSQVRWSLDQKNSLFGGMPGSGKTLAMRVVALGAVLDPSVVPIIFELKGTGEFDAFEPICPRGMYGSGPDEDTKARAAASIAWLLEECERRARLVSGYAKQGLNSTSNGNRAMVDRDVRLRPILAIYDEIQELITDKDIGKAVVGMLTSLIKRGRALLIHVMIGTQRIDKESVPRGISSNIANRACFAVPSHVEVDLVLGTGAYNAGARPTTFHTATDGDSGDSGWCWRAGSGPMAPFRFAFVANEQARTVLGRVIAERTRLGVMPADDDEDLTFRDWLADVRDVFRAGEAWVSWDQIADRLAEDQPGVYRDVTKDTVSAQLRSLGVESRNGRQGNQILKGARREDLTTAIEARAGREVATSVD